MADNITELARYMTSDLPKTVVSGVLGILGILYTAHKMGFKFNDKRKTDEFGKVLPRNVLELLQSTAETSELLAQNNKMLMELLHRQGQGEKSTPTDD